MTDTDKLIEEAREMPIKRVLTDGSTTYGAVSAELAHRLADALVRERGHRQQAEERLQEVEHPFDADEFKAMVVRAEQAEREIERKDEALRRIKPHLPGSPGRMQPFDRKVAFDAWWLNDLINAALAPVPATEGRER